MVVKTLKVSTSGRIISILAGIGAFVLLLFAFRVLLPYALIGGVLGWLAVILIYSAKRGDETFHIDAVTRQEVEETVRSGRKLASGMRQAIQKLSQTEIRQQVEDLCRIAESIFELLKKDPKDLRVVKEFNTHYLEPTNKIIVKYVELATVRPMPADAVETLEKTEKSLKSIRTTFLKQKERMLNNDVMDLDTEIKVFETLANNINSTSSKTEKKDSSSSEGGTY